MLDYVGYYWCWQFFELLIVLLQFKCVYLDSEVWFEVFFGINVDLLYMGWVVGNGEYVCQVFCYFGFFGIQYGCEGEMVQFIICFEQVE